MTDEAEPITVLPITTPVRAFEYHEGSVIAVSVFPDRRRMVTGSTDGTLCLWNLKDSVLLKALEGHNAQVSAVAVSRDGRLIASGDDNGELIAWDGDTGEHLTAFGIYDDGDPGKKRRVTSLDFSPDGATLVIASEYSTGMWCTKTWQLQRPRFHDSGFANCVRYSPSGKLLAIANYGKVGIYRPRTRECIAPLNVSKALLKKPAWSPDSTRLLSLGNPNSMWSLPIGSSDNFSIREWDPSTWKQVGNPWEGHTKSINAIAINPAGTLAASASDDNHVRLWQLSDRRTIAIFQHSDPVYCVTFSTDGNHILSGGKDTKILEWRVPKDALLGDDAASPLFDVKVNSKILDINTAVGHACINGDLNTAEEQLTQEIDADRNNYTLYANRSFVLARKLDWNCALHDAHTSINIQPSLMGYISKGIAYCGKMQFQDAMKSFDIAFMFTNGDSKAIHFLLLIKAIVQFNANRHEDAILRIQELAAACPNADTLVCHVVEAYLRVQLGISASNGARHNEAADHFTAAVEASTSTLKSAIHSIYQDFVVLFGWDLKALWQTANQNRCNVLLCAGRLEEALQSYRYMMDMSDETTKTSCLDWSTDFKEKCTALYAANGHAALGASGDDALAARDYDRAIELYSAAIELDAASDTVFANRCKAELEKMLWEEALLDAEKVIELIPSSYLGYHLKHEALDGAQRYDEALEAFQTMLSKLDNTPNTQLQELRQHYLSLSEAEGAIRNAILPRMENTPPRLFDTTTGLLCDTEAQITTFKTSTEYKQLLSSTMKRADLRTERITDVVVIYFRYVMLSHRWQGKEPLLQDIQDKMVYELDAVDGIVKLQSFCRVVRDAGYCWAWSDTCCIDKNNNVELQGSVTSMFVWYRHSALTIIYLSDVLPSSKSGALANSEWIRRGWTVQEFLAPKVVLFYQKDWTLYLDDRSSNHKESVVIMQELENATGIDRQALVSFCPGTTGAREKLQWASTRVTTLQEDIAYSLFGIFGIHLPVIYGEKKQSALGRLLQEVVAQSGDICALDWVGKPSEFNSCLPAEITSYVARSWTPPPLSEEEMQTSVSLLRGAGVIEPALRLYQRLYDLSAPRFAHRRLHLHCIAFPVTEVRQRHAEDKDTHFTYEVKADGLQDVLIATEDTLIQFSRAKRTRRKFLLVRPWDRQVLELPDSADDTQSEDDDWVDAQSPLHDSPGLSPEDYELNNSESHSQVLQLIVRLGQPFSAFLLAQQAGGEYKRVATDRNVVTRVKEMTSVHNMMDVRTLEIL